MDNQDEVNMNYDGKVYSGMLAIVAEGSSCLNDLDEGVSVDDLRLQDLAYGGAVLQSWKRNLSAFYSCPKS